MRKPFTFEETQKAIVLKVTTYCPEKWLLIDQETGQVFRGNAGGHWDKMNLKTKEQ
jgi:hypothetical protein